LNPARAINTVLFVPGSRPDRFEKALASGADMVCVDLEDAVAEDAKDQARSAVISALAEGNPRLAVRINALTTEFGLHDLLALKSLGAPPPLLFVPMVESARDIAIIATVLALESPVIVPLVETASALRAAAEIARSDKVAAMMFGGGDLSADIGVELAWEPLVVARGQFVLACAGAEIGIIDVPFIRLDDASGLEEEAQKAKALGFTAKAAIHPAQLPAIRQAFGPTEAQIQEARDAVEAFRLAGGKAVRHQGRMLEAPLMRRYEAILSSQEKLDA